MPAITFDNFGGGLDLRRDAAHSAGNVLTKLSNAYINTGKAVKKRPCLRAFATLEAGTKGLRAAGGKLNTFYGAGALITHANPLFRANRVPHPTVATAVTKAYYAENFNGLLYAAIGYANGSVRHHYLDHEGLTVWTIAAYIVGAERRPAVANGFRYRVQSIAGAGLSGGVEPAWPLTAGGTVVDNEVTWVADTNVITDVNCPHSRLVKKLDQKIYSASLSNVRYCKTGDCRDWTAVNDAGFIPSGISAPGSDTVTALGDFAGDIAIFYADSLQIWDVDANPANNVRKNLSPNTGTLHADTAQALASDLIFLSQQGFRSAALIALTENLQENDVGSAIDSLRREIADSDEPASIYYPKLGQLWCVNGGKAYVYSFSRAAKLSAWQTYTFPVAIEASAILNNQLYVRSGDEVYIVDDEEFTDFGTPPLVEVDMYYQDAKTPGVLKQFVGFDGLVTGSPSVGFKTQLKNESTGAVVEVTTQLLQVSGDMRPGSLNPMELCAVAVAPTIRHQADEDFRLSSLMLHYHELGAI